MFGDSGFDSKTRVAMCKNLTHFAQMELQNAEREKTRKRKRNALTAQGLEDYLKRKREAFKQADDDEKSGKNGKNYWIVPGV